MPASFQDLVSLMARLRAPEGGCPWDLEQDYRTLAPMTLEEAYEVFDAAGYALAGRPIELRDELGDLLFHIVFYSQIAAERAEFTIDEVIDAVHAKMVRRHPHIFGETTARDADEVARNWQKIKEAEKGDEADKSLLDAVSSNRPALAEAHQLSSRAAKVGFDWQNVGDILDKLQEELNELRAAVKEDETKVREEFGDFLFAATNIARHLQIDSEAALKNANRKFRRRFLYVERELNGRGVKLTDASLEEMEALWQEAKREEK